MWFQLILHVAWAFAFIASPLACGSNSANGKSAVYEFCKTFKSPNYKSDCLRAASHASFYSEEVPDFCKTFRNYWYRVYCVDRLRNSKFDEGVLEVCMDTEDPKLILPPPESEKLECAIDAAKASDVTENSKQFFVESRVKWPYGARDAIRNVKIQASQACRNWQFFEFVNASWKSDDCGPSGNSYLCSTPAYCSRDVKSNNPTIEYSGFIE